MKVIRIAVVILIIVVLYGLVYSYQQKKYSQVYYDALLRFLKENHLEVESIKERRGFLSSHVEAHLKFSQDVYNFKNTLFLIQDIVYGPLLFIRQGFVKNISFGKAYIHSQILLSEYPKTIEACFKQQPLLQMDTIISFKGSIQTAFYQGACEILNEPLLSWPGFSGEFNLEQHRQEKMFFSIKLPQVYFSTKDVQVYLNNFLMRAGMQKADQNRFVHFEARASEFAVQYKDESLLDAENITLINNDHIIHNDVEASLKLVAKKIALDEIVGTLTTEAGAIISHINNEGAFGFILSQNLLLKTNEGILHGSARFNFTPALQGTLNVKYSKSLLNALNKNPGIKHLSSLEEMMQPWLNQGELKDANENYLFEANFTKLEIPASYKHYLNLLPNLYKNQCEINIATAESRSPYQIRYGFAEGNIIGEHARLGPLLLSTHFNCHKVKDFQTVYAIVDGKEVYFSKPYEAAMSSLNLLFPEDFVRFPLKPGS